MPKTKANWSAYDARQVVAKLRRKLRKRDRWDVNLYQCTMRPAEPRFLVSIDRLTGDTFGGFGYLVEVAVVVGPDTIDWRLPSERFSQDVRDWLVKLVTNARKVV